MSGFRSGWILDFPARVRRYGRPRSGRSRVAGLGCDVTGNATVSGFGSGHLRHFSAESRGCSAWGEKYREKMRIEGEVFRESKPKIGRNGAFEGQKVSFFGGLTRDPSGSPGCLQCVAGDFSRRKVRIFGRFPQCRETSGVHPGQEGKGEAFRGRFSADFMPKVSKFGRKLAFTAL